MHINKNVGFTLIELLVLLFIVALSVTAGWFWGRIGAKVSTQREAVRVGVAHYEADKEGGSQFTWTINSVNGVNR